MSEMPRRDRDWAICVPERRAATWPVGKNSREKREEASLLFGGEPRRLDKSQRLARGMRSFARTFSISSAPSVSSDSSYFFSSYHRIARLCMRRGCYFGAQPWRVDALTRRFDFLIPARSSTLIPEVELENGTWHFIVNPPLKFTLTEWSTVFGIRVYFSRRRNRMNRARPYVLFLFENEFLSTRRIRPSRIPLRTLVSLCLSLLF